MPKGNLYSATRATYVSAMKYHTSAHRHEIIIKKCYSGFSLAKKIDDPQQTIYVNLGYLVPSPIEAPPGMASAESPWPPCNKD